MIDLDEIKSIMAARSETTKILGGMFSKPPRFADVYFLCKALAEAMDIVEVVDEKDELLEGYNDLQDWYDKASEIKPEIVDIKLTEEFEGLFRNPTAMSANFPADSSIVDTYEACGYKADGDISPSNLAQMLFFISFMAGKCAEEKDVEKIRKSSRLQAAFIENHIMPLLSDFCAILYERAVSYGIYRYIAVILHGYMNYDAATMKYF